MRKLLLFMLATLVLAPGASFAAPAAMVQVTRAGFVPASVSIKTGEAVAWTNLDTVAHQVVFKQRNGVGCAQPLVLQPTATASCTFAKTGKFTYSDPTQKGAGFKGTVTVAQAPLGVTLAAAPTVVTYGGRSTLSGSISTGASGEKVDVLAQPCGESSLARLTTLSTTTGGAYSYGAQPTRTTTYQARYKNAQSGTVAVRVRPALRLAKVAPHRYSVRVTAAVSFRGRLVFFQRFSVSAARWVTVKRVALTRTTAGIAPTQVSSATFRSTVKARLKVRAVLPPSQAGACYLAGVSKTIRS
jgi:plastocyanin